MKPTAAVLVLVAFLACTAERFEREDERARFNSTVEGRVVSEGLDAMEVTPAGGIDLVTVALSRGRVLTVSDCESIALRNNLAYRVTLLQTQLRDDQVRASFAAFLPQGDAKLVVKERNNDPLVKAAAGVAAFDDKETERFTLGLVLPIFDFGATWFAYGIAKDERMQERLAALRARQALIRDVRVAYIRLAGAVSDADLLGAEVESAREAVRVARALEREGVGAGADTAFVEAGLARAERDETLARRDVLVARSALARTMSLPVWTEFRIDTTVPPPPTPPASAAAVRDLEQTALMRRPEVRSQDLERGIAAARVRQTFAEFFPRLDATFDFEWTSNSHVVNPSFFAGGISVAHALLNGSRTLWKYHAAGQQVDVEKERSLLVAMGVVYEVDLRVLDLVRANDAIVAGERLVAAQDRLLEQTRARQREALASGADVTRSIADRSAAQRELNRARVDVHVAWHELRAAIADDVSGTADDEAEALTAPQVVETSASSRPASEEEHP